MRWFQNLDTHKKLLLTFSILMLATMFSGSWSIVTGIQLRQLVDQNQEQVAYLEQTAKAQADFQGLMVMSRNYWLTRSPFYLGQAWRYQQQIDEYLRNALMAAQNPDEREDINTLKALLSSHVESLEQIGEKILLETNTTEEQAELLVPPHQDSPPENGAQPPPPDNQNIEEPSSTEPPTQNNGQTAPIRGFTSEEVIMQADQAANQALIHLQNMTAKRGLKVLEVNNQIITLTVRLVVFSLTSLFLLTILAIFSARVAKQVAEPILHLTNAIVSFENNTFQPKQLDKYTRSQSELGQLARAFTEMASSIITSLRLKDELVSAAARFVPTQYLDLLEKDSIIEIKLGDHVSAEMAVMFSDVRGFTTFSERMTPQQNFDFVNVYLELVSPIIQQNDGFIVKFLGDGMMAVFPYGTESAVRAGIQKQAAILKFNAEVEERGLPPVEIGIGIHTGHMMVGMVGEELRMQGDAFSDTVNLTSRIEGLNKFFGTSMIITAEILMRLPTPVPYQMLYLGKVEVKGRQQPIDLYEIFDGQPQDYIALKLAIKEDFERGLKAYQSGNFSKAKEHFDAVLEIAPEDQAASIYAQRIDEWLGKEPPDHWEGVEVMKDK